jgi:hypothetical protein
LSLSWELEHFPAIRTAFFGLQLLSAENHIGDSISDEQSKKEGELTRN